MFTRGLCERRVPRKLRTGHLYNNNAHGMTAASVELCRSHESWGTSNLGILAQRAVMRYSHTAKASAESAGPTSRATRFLAARTTGLVPSVCQNPGPARTPSASSAGKRWTAWSGYTEAIIVDARRQKDVLTPTLPLPAAADSSLVNRSLLRAAP
jgi:hypothetical protein